MLYIKGCVVILTFSSQIGLKYSGDAVSHPPSVFVDAKCDIHGMLRGPFLYLKNILYSEILLKINPLFVINNPLVRDRQIYVSIYF